MALMIFGAVQHATALGTAFTYQGRLDDTGQCADGYYAFQFSLWDQQAPGGTKLFDNTTDTSEVLVTNGLFTVTLDFGPAAFTGNTYYLDTMVHTNTFPTFTDLSPRLLIMPTPYAIYAETSGGVAPGSITGTDIASYHYHRQHRQRAGRQEPQRFGGCSNALFQHARSDHFQCRRHHHVA